MAIIKRSGSYQVRLEGADGQIMSKTFMKKEDALKQELEWKSQKRDGHLMSTSVLQVTLDKYFEEWFRDVSAETSEKEKSGWRKEQAALYKRYIAPMLGTTKLRVIRPSHVKKVLNEVALDGKSAQTRLHVYGLLRKMLGDAVEVYEYLNRNPVAKKLRPVVPEREAPFLNIDQSKRLLAHVDDKKYGLAIWVQLYLGLRAGELQALRWEDIDLETGRVTIRRNYVRKTDTFVDFPKGKKQHGHNLPPELLERLGRCREQAVGELVVISPKGNVLPYRWYLKRLKGYLKELGLPKLGTHGLRHSTSELYLQNGAHQDDIRKLFAHSSLRVTERYMHGRESNLEKVTVGLRLFPLGPTQNRPKMAN